MRAFPLCFAALAAFFLFADASLAHKVSVFAFVDGDEIQVECSFSRSQKVKNGALVVTDLETGDTLLQGVTDEQGIFRFRPSDEFLLTGHGLNIRLDAGEGHRDDWKMPAEELRALLAPVKQALTRQRERDPDWRDIIGGIGWIVGLLGLVTYLKYRRR